MAGQAARIKPRIYIAGKIAKNDFRHGLVPGLRGWETVNGPLDCGGFDYVGPFFRACDHGCYHRTGSHGLAAAGCDGLEITQRQVFSVNQAALASADIVIAFIEAVDCYGTLVEIGWAACAGISICLAFAPDVDYADLWYAQMASASPTVAIVASYDLTMFVSKIVFDWRCQQ